MSTVDLHVDIQRCYACASLPELVVLTLARCDDEISRLKEIIRMRGKHAETCDFHGECRCELQEFE